MPNIGDIYTAIVYYSGQSGNNKPRPVIITNVLNSDFYTIAEITSVPPNPSGYFGKFKEPITKWQESGLDDPSWVKCYKGNVHNIHISRLHQYIGDMNKEDFQNAIKNIYYNNN